MNRDILSEEEVSRLSWRYDKATDIKSLVVSHEAIREELKNTQQVVNNLIKENGVLRKKAFGG